MRTRKQELRKCQPALHCFLPKRLISPSMLAILRDMLVMERCGSSAKWWWLGRAWSDSSVFMIFARGRPSPLTGSGGGQVAEVCAVSSWRKALGTSRSGSSALRWLPRRIFEYAFAAFDQVEQQLGAPVQVKALPAANEAAETPKVAKPKRTEAKPLTAQFQARDTSHTAESEESRNRHSTVRRQL